MAVTPVDSLYVRGARNFTDPVSPSVIPALTQPQRDNHQASLDSCQKAEFLSAFFLLTQPAAAPQTAYVYQEQSL